MNKADPPSAASPPAPAWEDAPTVVATDAPTREVRDLEGEWVLAWEDGSPLVPGNPRYELRTELARGGLGRIHFAWDRRLARAVAIKEPLTEGARARFYREALLTARLQHPGIVPIYDAGNGGDGAPFYAMRLLEEGRSFSDAIAATSSLDERLTLLPHVIAAADAVAYAHGRRIIHRDLKPDNILLGPFGETVVIDWGLAKDLAAFEPDDGGDAEAPAGGPAPPPLSAHGRPPSGAGYTPSPSPGLSTPLTLAGTTVGTPAYMSPEQVFQGLVDERTDVYSLGAVLLELLLGKRAAAGGRQAIGSEAALRRLLPPGVPADLVAILRTAMAEEPADRYPSARELAADLRRFAAGQLVKAHVYSPAARLARWLSRHRWPVGIAAFSLLLLALFAIAGVRGVIHQRNLAEEKNDALTLVHARTSLDRDPTATVAWMATYREQAKHQDLLRSLVAEAAARGVARHILKFSDRVQAVSFARDGELLVGADYARFLRVFDRRDGRLLGEWERPGGTSLLRVIERPASPPGGAAGAGLAGLEVLTGGADGRLLLYDLGSGAVKTFTGHGGVVRSLSVLADGNTVFSSASDGSVYQWDLAAGSGRLLARHQGSARAVAVSSDLAVAISGGLDGAIFTIDLAGGRPPRILRTGQQIGDLALAPGSTADALEVATAGDDFRVRLWNLQTGESRTLTEHGGIVAAIVFSPDGRLLASASRDRTVRVTELAAGAGEATRIFTGHTDDIETVVFSPDGRRLASAGLDGTVRLVDLETGRQQVLGGAKLMIERLVFSPDGEWLAAGTQDLDMRLWKVGGEKVTVLAGHRNDVDALLFVPGPGGAPAALVSAGHDKRLLVWRRDGEGFSRTPRELAGHSQTVDQLALLPDGRHLVSGSGDHDIRIWDLATGVSQRLDPEQHGHSISGLALAEDGRVLISSSLDGAVCVWDLDGQGGGRPRHRLEGHDGAVQALALSPDRRLLATGGADRKLRLWDWRAGRLIGELLGHDDQIGILAFSPDGRRLASGSWNGGLRLWQGEGFADGSRLAGHTERVRGLVFSPDGKTLASSSIDRSIRLWDMPGGRVRVLNGHEASVRHLVFSPDGSLLSSSSTDRTARLWDVATGELRALRRYDAIVTVSAFSADGKFLAVGGWDKLVHVYPFRPENLLPAGPGSSRRLIRELTTVSTDENGKIATRPPAP